MPGLISIGTIYHKTKTKNSFNLFYIKTKPQDHFFNSSMICSPSINIPSTVIYGMAEFNLKDYKFYSKNNPCMLYNKEKSYCNLCKRFFKGKSGAQSHCSKIHHITLDGRELCDDTIEQKVISNTEITPIEIKTDENNATDNNSSINEKIKKIDDKLNLNFKINALESQGLYTQANKIRDEFDLHKVISEEPSKDTFDDEMLNVMWICESDVTRKNKIFELITMKYAGVSDDTIMAGLMNLPAPESQKSQSSDLMNVLMLQSLLNANKNPMDNLIKYQSLLPKKTPLNLDEISNRIQEFQSTSKSPPSKSSTVPNDVSAKPTGKLSFKRVWTKSYTPKNMTK